MAPIGLLVVDNQGRTVALDVKSTGGEFERPIHVSSNELAEMTVQTRRYDLYRVFGVTQNKAKLRIAEDVGGVAEDIRRHLTGLPDGVEVDGVSIEPAALPFDATINLNIPSEEEFEPEE